MGVIPRIPILGLITEPNALLAGGKGALRVASNVMITRAGQAEPVFGLARNAELAATSPGGNYLPVTKIPYDAGGTANDILVSSRQDASTYDWRWGRGGGVVSTGVKPPPDESLIDMKGLVARKNLYLATSVGIKKLTSPSDTAAESLMYEQPAIWVVDPGVAGTAIPANKAVAYRVLVRKTDPNGYIIRSAPCQWTRFVNRSAGTRDPDLTIPLGSYVVAGDVIEVYRTKAVADTAVPSDETFLAREYTVTSGDVTNGYALILDTLVEAMLGAPCYVNASQQGILLGNEPPPIAHDMAWFGGVAWYANLIGRYYVSTTLTKILGDTPGSPGDVGLRRQRISVSMTNGSPVITMASTTGLVAGMMAADNLTNPTTTDGGGIKKGTYIVTVDSGVQVTLSQNCTLTDAARNVDFRDKLTVAGTEFYFGVGSVVPPDQVAERIIAFGYSGGDTETLIRETTQYLAAMVGRVMRTTHTVLISDDTISRPGQVLIREAYPGGSAFTVLLNRSSVSELDLGGAGQTAIRDVLPNGLAWSKLDQPEAVPLPYYARVGDSRRRIMRIFSLENALIVLKEDGIFRVSGTAPDGWRVDGPYHGAATLVPDAACVLDGWVYALTDRGIIRTDGAAVELISDPLIGDQLRDLQRTYAIGTLTQSNRVGFFMLAHPRRRLVLLSTPVSAPLGEAVGASGSASAVLFSPVTGAFSTKYLRATGWRCGCYDPRKDALYVARGGGYWELQKERQAEADPESVRDDSRSVTIATVDSSTKILTFSALDGWEPAAGDIVYRSGNRAVVTLVVGGNVYVDNVAGFTTGAATAIEGIPVSLEWQSIMPAPHQSAHFRELAVHLAALDEAGPDAIDVQLGGTNDRTSTLALVTARTTFGSATDRPVRAFLPREIARCSSIRPFVYIADAEWYGLVQGISLVFEPTSERVVRA